MTTILAAVAVVLFAILIAVCVFGFFLYQQEKWNDWKDEVKEKSSNNHYGYVQTPYQMTQDWRVGKLINRVDQLENEVMVDNGEGTLTERIEKLEKDVQELNQFYYIPSDDDESLVDMMKNLQERCDALDRKMIDCNADIHDLRFKYEVLKSSYSKQSEYNITVGDDPNQMQNGTTVSTAETIPHFITQYRRTIPYVKSPYEYCKIRFKTIEDAKK